MAIPLFTGPSSLRDRGERIAFFLTLFFAVPSAALVGFFLHERVGESEVALFVVVAMIYITLARGRLIGSSVMIHAAQNPRVFSIVKEACAALAIPMPVIFVREDYVVPVAALGFGEPYALVISSHWIEHFEDDELAFMVGRQLGHVAAGHTRFLSLLSVNGNENPLISLIFGAWLRSCDFTSDKIGLLVCGSLEAATRAIAVASFHKYGRQVDIRQFSEQRREIARDGVMQWGEWLGAEPYATHRIERMEAFLTTAQYASAKHWFARPRSTEPPRLTAPGQQSVQRTDCAGWWRRAAATFIDLVVVFSLVSSLSGEASRVEPPRHPATVGARAVTAAGVTRVQANSPSSRGILLADPMATVRAFAALSLSFLYMIALVGVAGQTFGMMIAGVRVVATDFRAPGILRSAWRYLLAFTLWWLIVPLSALSRRVMLHDRWSGTRLIGSERLLSRDFETVSEITP